MKHSDIDWPLVIRQLRKAGVCGAEVGRLCHKYPAWTVNLEAGTVAEVMFGDGLKLLALHRQYCGVAASNKIIGNLTWLFGVLT